MTDFAAFVAQQDAKNTIQLNVLKHCFMLCDALIQNYHDYAIKGHQHHIYTHGDPGGHHAEQIEKLKQGISPINFTVDTGRKYHKIVFTDGGVSRSVHAFIDKKTGEVYKSASWKAPAKGVRYDLRNIKQREWLLENADWSGGYLYSR